MSRGRPLIVGNWKMHGLRADLAEVAALGASLKRAPGCEVVVCPPFTLLAAAAEIARGTAIAIGAQDCASAATGAFTGEVSAGMLRDAGCAHVILGHSERRAGHGETSAQVRAKAQAALAAGLSPILCVGETLAERQAGRAAAVVAAQARESAPEEAVVTLAYEPVWAIGSGRTPEPGEIADAHAAIRTALAERCGRVLYGGSVKPENAGAIFAVPGVDGALVGGASLAAREFLAIIAAHPAY